MSALKLAQGAFLGGAIGALIVALGITFLASNPVGYINPYKQIYSTAGRHPSAAHPGTTRPFP